LKDKAKHILLLNSSGVALYQYFSDGWGCNIEETHFDPASTLMRQGKRRS
jgi:hypothetical protein